MKQVYRIIITPYHFDIWDIFTENKELFESLKPARTVEDAIDILGVDTWEQLLESYMIIETPYILLGETQIKQPDY